MAGRNHGKWAKYNREIESIAANNPNMGYADIARSILNTTESTKQSQDVNLLRTYVKRHLARNQNKSNVAKILLFDLETSHIIARCWNKFPDHINDDDIIKDWMILCWGAKWLFNDEVLTAACTPKEIKEGNDKRIVQTLWNLMDEADIVIAHNLNRFDNKKIKTRFLKWDLKKPSPYRQIDTLKIARSEFAVTSNRLDYLGKKFLEIGGKEETEKGLWNKVEEGDKEAMSRMVTYVERDVTLLEDVYLYLRPYARSHPNIGLYIGEDVHSCPTCGSDDITWGGSDYATNTQLYASFRCNKCGSLGRSRKGAIKDKGNLTVSPSR